MKAYKAFTKVQTKMTMREKDKDMQKNNIIKMVNDFHITTWIILKDI